MKTSGQHLLAEFKGCNPKALNDLAFVEASMRKAAAVARATVVNASFHQFGPQGVSGVLVLAESHLSVHTWPEHGYAATDIYTCGEDCFPELAQASLAQALGATGYELMRIERGIEQGPRGMRMVAHGDERCPAPTPASAPSAQLGDELAKTRQRSNGA